MIRQLHIHNCSKQRIIAKTKKEIMKLMEREKNTIFLVLLIEFKTKT